jgi:dolichol-phosphate mannosyltransferase
MRYLIAIPVFNEEKYLLGMLADVRRYAPDILVIDDGSTDATPELLAQQSGIRVLTHPENRGYGQSLIDAFDYAIRHQYDWLITMDCDLQHEPSQIPRFLDAIAANDTDIISGSRYLCSEEGEGLPPSDRRRINQAITLLLNHLLEISITDAFCGFKAYRVSSLARLFLTIPGYEMPLELWAQAAQEGLRIREIPVKLIYNDPTRHFGGMLDDPNVRLLHYLEVLLRSVSEEGRPIHTPAGAGRER